ncbi:MAG: polyhydroxyalkanoate depolymerase, partial [Planctomycetota bacterium]|nr:polyhydroxyalkanoate depolymerase [Planctomycetota bacterium]
PQGAAIAATRAWLEQPAAERARQIPDVKLSGADAATAVQMVFDRLRDEARAARADELATTDGARRKPTNLLTVRAAGKALKVYERTFGDAPDRGHSLWISMHGGGGAPARVNDGQWNNQIELYQPKEGIYVAPRAPTNTWNLWHEGHIDDLFDRLIENYVIDRGVNPNRVYLMGYSAGGDGVYQLAPRMADRFAAASMMAGHPNGVPMDGVRNLPFMIWMGANDGAYKRNEQAATY